MNQAKRRIVDEIVKKAFRNLLKTPTDRFPEIFDSLNSWHWHECLGEQPEGWEKIPNYEKPSLFGFWRANNVTKHDIINPINRFIEKVTGEKELLRYHHIHNLEKNNEQFEAWYDGQFRDLSQDDEWFESWYKDKEWRL